MLFLFCFCYGVVRVCLFHALWSPGGEELTSWLSFMMSSCVVFTFHCYPGSCVGLDCIDS